MNRIFSIFLLTSVIVFGGCTKQETKENLRNIKGGLKNTWHSVKEGVSDTTREFNEQTR